MSRAVLSIGSNLGDRLAHLRSAVDGLGPAVVAVSPVYETAPWGGVDQDDYLNAVLVVDDPATDARGWLDRARTLEGAAGRTREVRWGPRTLDVDVVVVEGGTSADPELTLPHPHAHERAFVLVPWRDVDPRAVLPGRGRVADLAAALDPAAVRPRPDLTLRPNPAQASPVDRAGQTGPVGSADPDGPAGATDPNARGADRAGAGDATAVGTPGEAGR